jgi:hypothetical protein
MFTLLPPARALAASNIISGFSWGCSSSGSQSSQGTCVTGTWTAPSSSVVIANYPSSPSCPTTTNAESAASYAQGVCQSIGSTSAKATCNSSTYALTLFPTGDCTGTGQTAASGSIGCAPATGGSQGVSVIQCTSGASSTSIAFASIVLMLVAAATNSAL